MDEQAFIQGLAASNRQRLRRFPDKRRAEAFIENLFDFVFSNASVAGDIEEDVEARYAALKKALKNLLQEVGQEESKGGAHVSQFFSALPRIHAALLKDAESVLQFDPAAQSLEEVIVTYPGFFATAVYRLSHQLWGQGIPLLPRLFSEYAHSKTGIDIHPAAIIGASFSIDHGTGIVIGETASIGDGVKIYQGVTLGALNVSKEEASRKRHPSIGNGVIIYSGATILGGDTVVGEGSIIGGNVWLTYSVPHNSVVYHKSEIKIKDKNPFPEPINFII